MALTSSILPYDKNWELKFREEQLTLVEKLNTDAKAVLHIGSTAVIGLVAKPEIDILVIIPSISDIANYSSKLTSIGYDFRGEEPGPPGHWYFSKNQNNKRTHKLHLCLEGHPCIEEQIIFRNYLRDNPTVAKNYGDLKLKYEKENTNGIAEYISKKSPFIIKIIERARAEGYVI